MKVTRASFIIAAIFTVVYAFYFSWFAVVRHAKTNSTRFDLGNAEQVVWNTAHGHWLEATDPHGEQQISRLVYHADLILLPIALLYRLWPQTEFLLILQTVLVASGGLAVWLLARRFSLSGIWPTVWTLIYFIQPSVEWSTILDFHAVTLATPLLLWTAWAALEKRWVSAIVLGSLVLITKEQAGLALIPIGIWAWFQGRRRLSVVWLAIVVMWSGLFLVQIIPSLQKSSGVLATTYESPLGVTSRAVIIGVFQHPKTAIRTVLAKHNRNYLINLIGPLGFMPLGSVWSLGGVVDIAINTLSSKPAQHLVSSHYQALITPWLLIGALATVQKLKRRYSRRTWLAGGLSTWTLATAVVGAWGLGPLPGARYDYSRVVRWRNEYAAPVKQWSHEIPAGASVAVTNNIGAHFSRRQYFYSFPLGITKVDYVVVLEGHSKAEVASQSEVTTMIDNLRNDPAWEILSRQNDFTVLRKK